MDEPLACWISLFLAMFWAYASSKQVNQQWLRSKLGNGSFRDCAGPAEFLKAVAWHFAQWYNVTFLLLSLLFIRTCWDIVFFEYIKDHFLSWSVYKETLDPNVTGIPLTPDEMDIHQGPLVIPTWIRFLSLFSIFPALGAFAYSVYQVIYRILFGTESITDDAGQKFLHMVVLGMPLVYIVMALRATIRMWAVMTGSCWLPYSHMEMPEEERRDLWNQLKAEEKSTYTQDLEVASGFQFFAVWCFGQVCRKALRNVIGEREITSDAGILLQLGVFGLHSFVVLGVVKTVFNMAIAIAGAFPELEADLEPIQQTVLKNVDPVFGFATILSVINMFLLARMNEVKKVLPNVNMKFNATRALLLIGQIQLTVLRAACTDGDTGTSKIIKAIHKLPFHWAKNLNWWFGMNQARLVHSSLLCFECLVVVIFNSITWNDLATNAANAREVADEADERRAPLLDAETRASNEARCGPLLVVDSP